MERSKEWLRKYEESFVYNPSVFNRIPKLLVLDIDGTLVSQKRRKQESDNKFEFQLRPGLFAFFKIAMQLEYQFAIWSAAPSPHVSLMIKKIQQEISTLNIQFEFVWSRDACQIDMKKGIILKPLKFVWAKYPNQFTVENTLVLDNTPRTYKKNKKNALQIKTFRNEHLETDQALLETLVRLQTLSHCKDVRLKKM